MCNLLLYLLFSIIFTIVTFYYTVWMPCRSVVLYTLVWRCSSYSMQLVRAHLLPRAFIHSVLHSCLYYSVGRTECVSSPATIVRCWRNSCSILYLVSQIVTKHHHVNEFKERLQRCSILYISTHTVSHLFLNFLPCATH